MDMKDSIYNENAGKLTDSKPGQERVVVLKGEARLKIKSWAIYVYWPRTIKTNVNIGMKADSRIMISWFNKWSEYKSRSIAIMVLGFGLGVRKDCSKCRT